MPGCDAGGESEGGVPLLSDARRCMGLVVAQAGGHHERQRRPCGPNRLGDPLTRPCVALLPPFPPVA